MIDWGFLLIKKIKTTFKSGYHVNIQKKNWRAQPESNWRPSASERYPIQVIEKQEKVTPLWINRLNLTLQSLLHNQDGRIFGCLKYRHALKIL